MLSPNDPLLQTAVFGEQVRQFLTGDIGSYLLDLAKRQSESATAELKDTDPFEPERIVALQMKIKVADLVMEWLGEAIAMGLQARESLENE